MRITCYSETKPSKCFQVYQFTILPILQYELKFSSMTNYVINNSDHISTEGGHAEHVLVTRISNKMDTSSTDKQIFECSICPSPVEFRSAIYIASASG